MHAAKQPRWVTAADPFSARRARLSLLLEMCIPFVPSPSYQSQPKDTTASVKNSSHFYVPSGLTTVTFPTPGKPVITRLVKQRSEDGKHKMLTCEADAVPEPTFQWSVNITDVSVAASAHSGHGDI